MLSDAVSSFTKDNLDLYLKELGKEFRKRNGKTMPAEIILIGGAAILASYGFRESTTDVDAVIRASGAMKEAINHVGDRFGLPNGWLNSDFTKTSSYSDKLIEISVPYRTFSNVLQVRTVSGAYLVAMKLRAGRAFKHDLSDIIGVLYEHHQAGTSLTLNEIREAVHTLYGEWDAIAQDMQHFIENVMEQADFEAIYNELKAEEEKSKDILIEFQESYPGVVNTQNASDILETLKKQKETAAPSADEESVKDSHLSSHDLSELYAELEKGLQDERAGNVTDFDDAMAEIKEKL